MCMNIKLPVDTVYHMIAFEPIIDNIEIMHHILVCGCPDLETTPGPLNQQWSCIVATISLANTRLVR
ncbi:hypothetical protein DPMN_179322 [Dreissena polymorpha]|uniref:Copper type II ascorbate-dependent monooxygenase N-terminal domain-containing protein n=1 Tax=Dreissena polymorpha TaxID=45954 RepID=A0A9D4IM19_DREPO|nr:hypothetical protein DPMN_179322 [Dreissena polymorpha]